MDRKVDENRNVRYTNKFTIANLFPAEDPYVAIRRELKMLTAADYIKTVKDVRYPKRSEMREFGKRYNGTDEVYIKIRVELLAASGFGMHTAFVMSFHYAAIPFDKESFPYREQEE